MDTATVVDVTHRALMLVLFLSLPAAITSAVIGLGVAMAQAVTQIHDQGLAQSLKLTHTARNSDPSFSRASMNGCS